MYSYGTPHMAEEKQDDQLEHTCSSYVRIRDVVLKTCQWRWTIGRSGERGSGISVPAAPHDDDDDDYNAVIAAVINFFVVVFVLFNRDLNPCVSASIRSSSLFSWHTESVYAIFDINIKTVLSPLVGGWCGHGIARAFTRSMMKKNSFQFFVFVHQYDHPPYFLDTQSLSMRSLRSLYTANFFVL